MCFPPISQMAEGRADPEIVGSMILDATPGREGFCSDQCWFEYELETRPMAIGSPDTAPFSIEYTDQYDWNR